MSFIHVPGAEDRDGGAMTKEQKIGEAIALRAKIKSSVSLRVQMLAAISETLGKNGIHTNDEVLAVLTIAIQDELEDTLPNEVILPGGTNCENE